MADLQMMSYMGISLALAMLAKLWLRPRRVNCGRCFLRDEACKEFGGVVRTHTYTDREAINMFYNIVKDVICYGADGEDPANETRFSYSFSTENSDKLTSGESTYGTRRISIEFKNGTILDSWKYSALSGSFFEYGGIYTEPLEENDVYALNDIFGIK